jgi:hypothetical protein
MIDPKRDEEFKQLLDKTVDGLNKGVLKESEWWEKNGPEIYEKNRKEYEIQQQRDKNFKGLTEKVMDSLTKSVEEDQLWWKENGEKVIENNLKEIHREKQRKIYIVVTSVISILIISSFLYFYT